MRTCFITVLAVAAVLSAQAQPRDPTPAAPSGAAAATAPTAARKPPPMGPVVNGFTTIHWDHLVPPDWDPFKDFKGVNMGALDDADPRAAQMLKQMREVWDNAPPNKSLAGMTVRIPGFVVPLEDTKEGLKEFLLVPYFGACVHSPPPPANQIIHVIASTPAKGLRSMDAVWISGRMTLDKTDSYMGMAGYHIEAQAVAPYQADKR